MGVGLHLISCSDSQIGISLLFLAKSLSLRQCYYLLLSVCLIIHGPLDDGISFFIVCMFSCVLGHDTSPLMK